MGTIPDYSVPIFEVLLGKNIYLTLGSSYENKVVRTLLERAIISLIIICFSEAVLGFSFSVLWIIPEK